jgi:HEAT repeat protein
MASTSFRIPRPLDTLNENWQTSSSPLLRERIMAWAKRRIMLGALALAAATGLAVSQNPPVKGPAPKEPDTTAEDQKVLRDLGIGVDAPALLDYFRKRTLPTADPKQIAALIRQLGDDDFDVREQAFSSLAALGAAASGGLSQHAKDNDTEVRKRVEELRQRLDAKAEPAIQSAAARLIARAKPAGAAEVLLAYVPFAVDPVVVNEVCKALGAVAVSDGRVESVVLKALEDAVPIKRAAAGEAILRAGAKDHLDAARALLKDADPNVRLRVAMAMVPRREKEAVPALIGLLGELSPDQLWPAEEVLVRLAGDKAPPVALGSNEATRKAARDAWQKWYTEHKDAIDLAKLEQPEALLGYTLVVQQNINKGVVGGKIRAPGEILELTPDKKVRWSFDLQNQPVDAQVIGENRVLVAEYLSMTVSERDFKGNVVWEKRLPNRPVGVQRLANGNTFVVMQNIVAEYDRKGNEVFSYQQNNPGQQIVRGKKLRGGEIVLLANNHLNNTGVFTRMDTKNKVLKTFPTAPVQSVFGSWDVLPTGGILVPEFQRQRVVEYDADGKEVKSFNIQFPLGASRLPNGHTLVIAQSPGRVIEFDREGREVWSYQNNAGNVFNAKKR